MTVGDQFLFVAFDTDTKLMVAYALGKRTADMTAAIHDGLVQPSCVAERGRERCRNYRPSTIR